MRKILGDDFWEMLFTVGVTIAVTISLILTIRSV